MSLLGNVNQNQVQQPLLREDRPNEEVKLFLEESIALENDNIRGVLEIDAGRNIKYFVLQTQQNRLEFRQLGRIWTAEELGR
jgi:hypothetical protein